MTYCILLMSYFSIIIANVSCAVARWLYIHMQVRLIDAHDGVIYWIKPTVTPAVYCPISFEGGSCHVNQNKAVSHLRKLLHVGCIISDK